MQYKTTIGAIILCVLSLAFPTAVRAELIVFGDSLSDTGNTQIASLGLVPSSGSGYVSGAFTNGLNWVEQFALARGDTLPQPERAGGTNYAHGGSRFTESGFVRPSLTTQLSSYKADLAVPNVIDPNDLHIFWGGSNDLLATTTDAKALEVATAVRAGMEDLYSLGARNFLVLNVPKLGVTPLARAQNRDLAELNRVSSEYNDLLEIEMATFRTGRSDLELFEFDVERFLDDVIASPAAFGLTEVEMAATDFTVNGTLFAPEGLAIAPPPSGVNASEYLFYDGLHPTAAAHQMLGNQVAFAMAVPEPSATTLMAMIAGLLFWRRRQPAAVA